MNNKALVDDISCELYKGEVLAITGPKGSGKSSLLRLLDRLVVWIPGLMAGMLLLGARPSYAAIYQFVVLAMIFAASGLTSLVITLLVRGWIFLTAEQLILQPGR